MRPSSRSQFVVFVAAALERGGVNQWAMRLNTEVVGVLLLRVVVTVQYRVEPGNSVECTFAA